MRQRDTIEAFGLSANLPTGWDGAIFRREVDLESTAAEGVENPTLHLANFALPPNRGDFGSGAVEVMGRRGVLVCLVEYGDDSVGTALFDHRRPAELKADDFATHTLQRPQAGQGGQQQFFTENDRAFCLYTVIGSHRMRNVLTPVANEALAGIVIS